MLESKRYTLGELSTALHERAEFKPKYGNTAKKGSEKSDNEKAVNDILKETDKLNKGIDKSKRKTNPENVDLDLNKTTMDVNFAYEPSDSYKERVKSLALGFSSPENQKNTKIKEENKGLDFEGNEEFYKQNAKKSKEVNKRETEDRHAGLKARMKDENNFKNKTVFKESKMKRLHFKKHTFLSEAQVLKYIPEDYKRNDSTFLVKDKTGTEYLVECVVDKTFNVPKLTILNKVNKQQIVEQLNRIQNLYEYKSSDYFTKSNEQPNTLSEMVEHCRQIEKDNSKL